MQSTCFFPQTRRLKGCKMKLFSFFSRQLSKKRNSDRAPSHWKTIKHSALFDKKWYLGHYPDVAASKADAAAHYLTEGYALGYNPSAAFDNDFYLNRYPDILFANMNPLLHYELYGRKEKREISRIKNAPVDYAGLSGSGKVLLVSHEFSLTGAPIALLNMAQALRESGMEPIMLSPCGGGLEDELRERSLKYVVDEHFLLRLYRRDRGLNKFLASFPVILFNTIDSLKYAALINTSNRKICWVHEGCFGYGCATRAFDLPRAFAKMDEVYSVGEYSKSFTDKHVPENKSKILLYGLDAVNTPAVEARENKLTFGIFGVCCERKGTDLFLEAVKKLPEKIKKNCRFKVVGRVDDNDFCRRLKKLAKNEPVVFTGELPHEKTLREMASVDVVVCPSLDDPMPIVMTEAMQLQKTLICSVLTGTASFITNGVNGYLYSPEEDNLSDIMADVWYDRERLSAVGRKCHKIYLQNFTTDIFAARVREIFRGCFSENQSSVVCPPAKEKIRRKCRVMVSNMPSTDIPLWQLADSETQRKISHNTGNIVIAHYGSKRLDYDFDWSSPWSTDDDIDEYLILAANCLRPSKNEISFERWFSFLDKLQKPLNIMGLGAQAVLEEMSPPRYAETLSPEMKKWVSMIADKCVSVGVRGEFTADVLKELGIKNVDVIGCPTWFVNGRNQPLVNKKEYSPLLRPVFHTAWDPYTPWHTGFHNALLNNMLRLADPKFVIQSEFGFLPYLAANRHLLQYLSHFDGGRLNDSITAIARHFGISEKEVCHNKKINNMFEVFTDIDKWEDFIKTRDFSCGFRIHGTIVSLKNGISAICLVSDSRTYELCDFLKIPFVPVNRMHPETMSLRTVYERADFSELNKRYPQLLENYVSFLNKNGIAHKFGK